MNKDTIYVVQINNSNEDYKVLYAGRSSRAACQVASEYKSVRITIHTPSQKNEGGE